MKKYLLVAIISFVTFGAFAQYKGDSGVGVNFGLAPSSEPHYHFTNFGLAAKYQYNIQDNIRLEGDLEYWMKDKEISIFDLAINAHYLFHIGEKVNLYPLLGIGYANVNVIEGMNRFLVNFGAGADYYVSTKVSIGLEIKYQWLRDFCRWPINVGVVYHF